MNLEIGMKISLKKPHPCGCFDFVIKRVGMDIGIMCLKCEHFVVVNRNKLEKNIKNNF